MMADGLRSAGEELREDWHEAVDETRMEMDMETNRQPSGIARAWRNPDLDHNQDPELDDDPETGRSY